MKGFVYCDTDSLYLANMTQDEIVRIKHAINKYAGKMGIKSMVDWENIAAEYRKQNADLAKAILQLSEELANITQETAELAAENKRLYMELDKVKLENVYLKKGDIII
jgi:hypothetical protein